MLVLHSLHGCAELSRELQAVHSPVSLLVDEVLNDLCLKNSIVLFEFDKGLIKFLVSKQRKWGHSTFRGSRTSTNYAICSVLPIAER